MKRKLQGKYEVTNVGGEKVKAFVPSPLPPKPPVEWDPALRGKFDEALLALGRLDALSILLPDVSLFLYSYIRKEAVLSSMIEGTQSSISALLVFEAEEEPGVPISDVQEVSNYVAALEHGLERLAGGFPVSLRLFREMHERLLAKGRGADTTPGEFRKSQNWIGGTRPGNAAFVPPPPGKVMECLSTFELFLHDRPGSTPPLLKAALAHLQFETIHPFLDGNGRLGRLLITLILCEAGVLKEPLLYLSLYFKTHRSAYYELLDRVRLNGDWEAWLDFFADAVITVANQAVEAARDLERLANEDRGKIHTLGRAAGSALLLHKELLRRPVNSPRKLEAATGLSHVTINKTLEHLATIGIVEEVTGHKRNRVFSYARYVDILNQGTELP